MNRLIACIVLALTLGGCWESESRLLPQNALDTPPIEGRFSLVDADEKGEPENWRASVSGKIAFVESYRDGEWLADSQLRFIQQNEDIYLVERTLEDPDSSIEYLFMVMTGDGAFALVTPPCSDKLLDAGLATNPSSACQFASYGNLRAATELYMVQFVGGDANADDIWHFEPD